MNITPHGYLRVKSLLCERLLVKQSQVVLKYPMRRFLKSTIKF